MAGLYQADAMEEWPHERGFVPVRAFGNRARTARGHVGCTAPDSSRGSVVA